MKSRDEKGQTRDSDSHSFFQPSMSSCHHAVLCSESTKFWGNIQCLSCLQPKLGGKYV